MNQDDIQKKIEDKLGSLTSKFEDNLEALPSGFDHRFFNKLAAEPAPQKSKPLWRRTAMGSLIAACLSIVLIRRKYFVAPNNLDQLILNDEIDLYDDLDVLMNWDESEETT